MKALIEAIRGASIDEARSKSLGDGKFEFQGKKGVWRTLKNGDKVFFTDGGERLADGPSSHAGSSDDRLNAAAERAVAARNKANADTSGKGWEDKNPGEMSNHQLRAAHADASSKAATAQRAYSATKQYDGESDEDFSDREAENFLELQKHQLAMDDVKKEMKKRGVKLESTEPGHNTMRSLVGDLLAEASGAYFKVGDTLKSSANVQGLKNGNSYKVVDMTKKSYPFGTFVTYTVQGDDGKELSITNAHLFMAPE